MPRATRVSTRVGTRNDGGLPCDSVGNGASPHPQAEVNHVADVPQAEAAVARGGAAGPVGAHAGAEVAFRERRAARAALSGGDGAGALRPRLLLGRGAEVLEDARRRLDVGRLRGRLHAEPDLRGGLLRPHRPHRGGARRVRPGEGEPTRSCCASSGRATTRRRACARATTWARSTARRSTRTARTQRETAEASRDAYQKALDAAGHGAITTEIREAPEYYYAEDYHQQYLAKNPDGYCGLGGTGVACPVGLAAARRVTSGDGRLLESP